MLNADLFNFSSAEELKLYQPPKPPTPSKPHSTPHLMSCAKSKQLAAADPTEKVPSLGESLFHEEHL